MGGATHCGRNEGKRSGDMILRSLNNCLEDRQLQKHRFFCLATKRALCQSIRQKVLGNADGIGDDGERWVDRAAAGKEAGVDNVKVVEVVSLAVNIEDGLFRVCAETAGAVLMADAFEGDALLEVGVEGDGAFGVTGLL